MPQSTAIPMLEKICDITYRSSFKIRGRSALDLGFSSSLNKDPESKEAARKGGLFLY
jgi:hypothetical protein